MVYRILDEMDGKQARKTGNSSPLGLLFDHGCDAFTTGLMALLLAKCLQLGNTFFLFPSLTAPQMIFFFTTLEEYYTGALYLSLGNGVTDGSVIMLAIFVFTAIVGNDWWLRRAVIHWGPDSYTLTFSQCLCVFIVFTQIFALFIK